MSCVPFQLSSEKAFGIDAPTSEIAKTKCGRKFLTETLWLVATRFDRTNDYTVCCIINRLFVFNHWPTAKNNYATDVISIT